ncbi:sulfite oxidase heme-binding subunit YedZ, partial [Chloroflexota bacterium]
ANPIQEIQLRTGRYALILLMLSLTPTPIHKLTGLTQVLALRRTLGLYAFVYTCLHLLNFVGLDYGFNLAWLWADISEKRYVVVGFGAFLILLILAITSTRGWKQRLDRNWKRLHRLVYIGGALAVLHYLWQVKLDLRAPLIYGAIIVLLLLLRIPKVGEAAGKLFKRRSNEPRE